MLSASGDGMFEAAGASSPLLSLVVAGGGAGMSASLGTPDWRAFVGAAFTMGHHSQARPMPMPTEPEKFEAQLPSPAAEPPTAPVVAIVAAPAAIAV